MGGWGALSGDDLVVKWRQDIVGDWLEELSGVDVLYLKAVTGRSPSAISLFADGTAASLAGTSGQHAVPARPEAPFPETWELSDERVLSFMSPMPPMPKYGMPDWTRERMNYDVLSVTDATLTLSDRRFGGEMVTVWRRVNSEEYQRRKAAEYGQALDALKRLAEGK